MDVNNAMRLRQGDFLAALKIGQCPAGTTPKSKIETLGKVTLLAPANLLVKKYKDRISELVKALESAKAEQQEQIIQAKTQLLEEKEKNQKLNFDLENLRNVHEQLMASLNQNQIKEETIDELRIENQNLRTSNEQYMKMYQVDLMSVQSSPSKDSDGQEKEESIGEEGEENGEDEEQ